MKTSWFASSSYLLGRRSASIALAVFVVGICGVANAQDKVTVTILPAATAPPAGTKCSPPQGGQKLCVKPDPVTTTPIGSSNNVKIIWHIGTAGWHFDQAKGIDIKNPGNWTHPAPSGSDFTSSNKKEGGVSYKYEVNVVKSGTKLTFDPTIMN